MSFNNLLVFAQNSHIPKYYRRKKDKNFYMPFKILELKDSVHICHVNSRLAIFEKFSQAIKIGSTYLGNLTYMKNFGIFLNVLGIQCLLHSSEISKTKLMTINKVYKRGDKVKIKILYKDEEKGKITVTLKNRNFTHHQQ